MRSDFFGSSLQGLPLLLFLLAEAPCFVTHFLSGLFFRLRCQVRSLVCVLLKLVRKGTQGVNHLLRLFRHRLTALSSSFLVDPNVKFL